MSENPYSQYRNPLATRYASKAMQELFSEQKRAETWRELWIYLAEEQRKLGLPIKQTQIQSLKRHKDHIDFQRIREIETELKHDVMSHLKAFGEVAEKGEPILHLGATSAYITDNADILILREALETILQKLSLLLKEFGKQIEKHQDRGMVGYTHFQPAQPVTLGKRFALWAQDFLWDAQELELCLEKMRPLGCKGATGTQASFMVLFKGKSSLVKRLDRAICRRMGFSSEVAVSGQTLSRKVDAWFLHALANLASSFSKLSYDSRLLQHRGEVFEAFSKLQVGSSAMAYKRNPMLAERMTGISRFLMNLAHNGTWTHAVQWLERSLDDSSNRRMVLPEAFLAADALCELGLRWVKGIEIDKKKMEANLQEYEAFFETEVAMMEGALEGQSRQELHEKFREESHRGKLQTTRKGISKRLFGAASQQAHAFYKQELTPFLKKQQKKGRLKHISEQVDSI